MSNLKKQAVALRLFTHDGTTYAKGKPVPDLPLNQFRDWEAAGLVKEAPAETTTTAAKRKG
jgi:hypothetical protein